MPPKKKASRATANRKLERPRKALKEALEAFREAAGNSEPVATAIWNLLTADEKESLQVHVPEADRGGSAKVIQKVSELAKGSTVASTDAKSFLAAAGRDVFRKKRIAERSLKLKFSQRVWAKACANRVGSIKKGRPNIVNDPKVTKQVREFLVANSLLCSHYRKIRGELIQCRALSRSKTKLWKLHKEMQDLMSLSSWLRHLKAEHPHFSKFKKKVDMCPVCHKYDKLVVPRVEKSIESALRSVQTVEQGYFAKLDEFWSSMTAAGKTDPDGKSSLQFVRGAIQYIDKNMANRRGKRTPDVPGARKHLFDLRESELKALNDLKSVLSLLESCEHHFHSFRRQHNCREKMEEDLPPDSVIIQLDYAENLTLPLGPVEEQSWFWATARLSFSTLGLYASFHKEGHQHKVYFHYVSQILDHTALHASVALKDCIRRLALPSSCKTLQIWSDCGPHFKAYAFVATAVDILQTHPQITAVYFNFFGEHHGKGRNDGQFGLQRLWLEAYSARHVVSSADTLLTALREGARETMLSDPPPVGPQYEIAHFHPSKPKTFLYLDAASMDLKIDYTYCLGFFRSTVSHVPARLVNYIYSDRIALVDGGQNLGKAIVVDRVCQDVHWRVSYRKDEPEKEALPEALLQRRFQAQKHVKIGITGRRQSEIQKLLADEKQRAKRSQKARRERLAFKSDDSSSSASDSSDSSSSWKRLGDVPIRNPQTILRIET